MAQHPFSIDFLDHVAIRVKDMEVSVKWYLQVLGLKKYQLEKWGPFPVFMFTGKTGVAIFPEKTKDSVARKSVDHFAFNVSNEAFDVALNHFKKLGIAYQIQDHHYFKSVYIQDPDAHTVELTTLMVNSEDFY